MHNNEVSTCSIMSRKDEKWEEIMSSMIHATLAESARVFPELAEGCGICLFSVVCNPKRVVIDRGADIESSHRRLPVRAYVRRHLTGITHRDLDSSMSTVDIGG